jgi:type II secretory pathway pseudopilin PulG
MTGVREVGARARRRRATRDRYGQDATATLSSATLSRKEAVRPAYTLVEVVVVLTLLVLLAALVVPPLARQLDRTAVAAATAEVAAALAIARDQAIAEGRPIAVRFDAPGARVTVLRGADTLLHRDLARAHAVSLTASRDSLAYLPTGLGAGAANLGVVVTRGASTRTLAVSRLGRVRW